MMFLSRRVRPSLSYCVGCDSLKEYATYCSRISFATQRCPWATARIAELS